MWWMTLFPDSFSWTFPRLFHRTDRVGHVSWPCWASNFSEWRLPVLFAQKDQQWNDNLNSPVIHIRNPAFGKSEEQRLVRVEEFQCDIVQVFLSDCLLNGGWTEWHATDLILDCGKPRLFNTFTCDERFHLYDRGNDGKWRKIPRNQRIYIVFLTKIKSKKSFGSH